MKTTCLFFVLATFISSGLGDLSDEFICKRITNDIKGLDTNFTGDTYHVAEREGNYMTETKSDRLKPYARDCLELYDKGVKRDGVYRVSPDDGCPIQVYCDMTNGGWTVMQRRKDGSVSFKRTWTEYVEGFGDLEGDFWLGLNQIHRLTKESSEIYIHLQQYDGKWLYAHYKDFTVNNAATAYKMNVDKYGFEGTIPEILGYHDNMKFSTFDRDNDNDSNSCSVLNEDSGWWFNSCYHLNPNGMYNYKQPGGLTYVLGGNIYMKNSVLKLKRNKQC